MWGIPEQIPLRGSVNTAYTIIGRQGVADATARLAQAMFQRIESVPSDRSFLHALDALEPEQLGQAALNAVTSLEQFGESNPGLEQLEEFQKLLRDVQSSTSSRAVSEVIGCVETLVEGTVTELFAGLNRAFESQPARVAEGISQCREALKGYQPRQANLRKVTEFLRILQKLRELPQFENMLIPETFRGVKTALLQQSRRIYEEAFTEVIRPKAWAILQNKLTTVEAFFKELENKGVRYARQVSAVQKRLEDVRQHARSEQSQLQSSVALELEGPDEDHVLSGMKTAANCSDLTQLVSLLEGEFQSRLRDHARDYCPHIDAGQASFATLILETADGEISPVPQRLVEDRLGTGHSLYQLVEATGIDCCVSHLWERGAPTCFFAGRDDQKFGLEPTELAILRLPRATSPADEEIRTELKRAFEGRCKVCHVGKNQHVCFRASAFGLLDLLRSASPDVTMQAMVDKHIEKARSALTVRGTRRERALGTFAEDKSWPVPSWLTSGGDVVATFVEGRECSIEKCNEWRAYE